MSGKFWDFGVILGVYHELDSSHAVLAVIYLERGLFGAPMWIRLRCGFGLGLLVSGLEWICG